MPIECHLIILWPVDVDLLRLVISRGIRLTTAGVVIGAIAALTLTRLIGNLLYKVSPRDPIAFGVALIVMLPVASIAWFPPGALRVSIPFARCGLNYGQNIGA